MIVMFGVANNKKYQLGSLVGIYAETSYLQQYHIIITERAEVCVVWTHLEDALARSSASGYYMWQ